MEYIQKQTCVAQTPEICQRFTFEKVGTGDNAYYHILPYLRLQTDAANSDTIEIKGSYRSEYRLAVVNGVVKVVQIPVTNGEAEDPTSGRWILQKIAGGKYLIKNVSTGTYLNMENNAVCLTQQQPRSTLWTLKAISLAMEKDYQQYTNTCGAASGKMIINYLTGQKLDDDAFKNQFYVANKQVYSTDIGGIKNTINMYLSEDFQYTSTYYEFDLFNLQKKLSGSLNKLAPTIINIKPHKNSTNPANPPSEQLPVFGYGYNPDLPNSEVSGHYFVVKGIYYNSVKQQYDGVINETHYKFGTTPKNNSSAMTNNIGGRDLVVEYSMLHEVYLQRYHGFAYVE